MSLNIIYSGACCDQLVIASTGDAGEKQGSRMGVYNYWTTNPYNYNRIYNHSSEEYYLYKTPAGNWLVRTLIELNTNFDPI